MITNKDEAKAMAEYISFDCKCKFNSTTFNSKQKWNNKIVWKKITFFTRRVSIILWSFSS